MILFYIIFPYSYPTASYPVKKSIWGTVILFCILLLYMLINNMWNLLWWCKVVVFCNYNDKVVQIWLQNYWFLESVLPAYISSLSSWYVLTISCFYSTCLKCDNPSENFLRINKKVVWVHLCICISANKKWLCE